MLSKSDFETAVAASKTLTRKPSNDVLLKLYALYKQATEGNAPEKGDFNMFDFVAKAKFEAWKQFSGKSSEEAMSEYVAEIERLKSAES